MGLTHEGAIGRFVTSTRDAVEHRNERGRAGGGPRRGGGTRARGSAVLDARSTRLALAGGWDATHLGLMLGGYLDFVRDAGVSETSSGKYDEGALSARGVGSLETGMG